MIGIIDYGLGNVKAFVNIFEKLNIPIVIAKKAEDLKNIQKVILPGVGSFDHATQMLDKSGMRQRLDEIVLQDHVPVLGVCVGMQMFASSSEEGKSPGLGWIKAQVKKIEISSFEKPIPHMGWNNIQPINKSPLLQSLDDNSQFYFLHSYYMSCKNKEDIIAETEYGDHFACAVNHANIYGVQFHPEKSHQFGIQLLKNFAEL